MVYMLVGSHMGLSLWTLQRRACFTFSQQRIGCKFRGLYQGLAALMGLREKGVNQRVLLNLFLLWILSGGACKPGQVLWVFVNE